MDNTNSQQPTDTGVVSTEPVTKPVAPPAEGMKVQESKSGTYATFRRIFLSTPERKSYTMLGLTLIAIIIVIVFVIRPMLVTISERKSEISILTADSRFLNERISTVLSIQEDILRYKQELSVLFDYFPEDQNTSELLRDLILSAEQLGLTVVDISAGKSDYIESNSQTLISGWLVVTLWGTSPDSILDYISEVEKLPIYPSIDQVSLVVDKGMYKLTCRIPISTVNPNITLFQSKE